MSKVMKREEQRLEDTWDLTTIFESDEAFETALKDVEQYLMDEVRKDWKKILSSININLNDSTTIDESLTYDIANQICSDGDLFNRVISAESNS